MANPFLVGDVSSSVSDSNTFNPFLTNTSATVQPSNDPFFTPFGGSNTIPDNTNPFLAFISKPESSQAVADLLGINENTSPPNVEDTSKTKPPPPRPAPPKRPPPRPMPPPPPPSHEAKELILSVTGEMDATSSHMLDRLAKTPSPTPIRDLLTPSPTPVSDLLGYEEIIPPVESVETVTQPPTVPKPERPKFPPKIDYLMDDLLEDVHIEEVSKESQPKHEKKRTPSIPENPPSINGSKSSSRKSSCEIMLPVRRLSHDVTESRKIMPDMSKISDRRKSDIGHFAPMLPVRKPSSQSDQSLVETKSSIQEINELEEPKNVESLSLSDAVIQSSIEPKEAVYIEEVNNEPTIQDTTSTWQKEENGLDYDSQQFAESFNQPVVETSPTDTRESVKSQSPQELAGTEQTAFSGINTAQLSFEKITTPPDCDTNEQEQPITFETSPFPLAPESLVETTIIQEDLSHETPFVDTVKTENESTSELFATENPFENNEDAFDAFAAKFEDSQGDSFGAATFDAFGGPIIDTVADSTMGFGVDDSFDSFLSTHPIPAAPQSTPARVTRNNSGESISENEFNVFIRPKTEGGVDEQVPSIAPPPKPTNIFSEGFSSRFNPFDQTSNDTSFKEQDLYAGQPMPQRSDSQETPPSPLFDEDVSQPLEEFPRVNYPGEGWEMELRQPNKKKITAHRFWKKIFVKIVYQGENPVLQLYNLKGDRDPFQELPLQPSYSVSDIGAQQYDQFGKIFTVKLLYIFYKEKAGFRPGQVTKAERLTTKLSQFAAYAIQGDYQGVKEFGSDLKKLGLPVEHGAQTTTLLKLGSHKFEDMKQFSICVEEALFKLSAHRDRALNYKVEDVQITVVDELFVDQNSQGSVLKQIARVRLFFLAFMCGMPDVELGVNDLVRQGKEVVGRHDIIPVVTEEWIRLEGVEFHNCVQQDEYDRTRTIKFKPPDACYIELMRFRVRPPKNRELPLQLKTTMNITGNKVELKADILVPGFTSRKLGQVPCEDVAIRFPIPECWIYLFRVEKHFRYGSVKSAHRRTGKVKGIERFLGTVDNLEPHLIEVTSGEAKYEHHHRSVVWRMPRLPKEGQGAYTTHNLVCRMTLTSFDQVPEQLDKYCYVEFTMPTSQVSHTTVRSVSIVNSEKDSPPEKYLRLMARHEYRVEIEHIHGEVEENPYMAATAVPRTPQPTIKEKPQPAAAASDSDSSS